MNAGEVPTSLTSTQKITGESPNLSQDLSRSILGSVDVVDTNLACVYPDHLIDLQK